MKAYSMDLRRRVLAACDRGESTKVVADRFGVCPAWVRRLKQRRRERGEIAPRSSGGDRRGKFRGVALEQLSQRVAAQPDLTLEQLREWASGELGIDCSVMAVCRALKQIGLTFKKSR
jgi:transposase